MEIERVLLFCVKQKLSLSQFAYLYCEHFGYYNQLDKYSEMFGDENKSILGSTLAKDLVERKYLEKKEGKIVITTKFRNEFVDEHEAIEELFDKYPSHAISTSGSQMTLKAGNRVTLGKTYYTYISKSVDEHIKVLEDLQFGINNNLLNISIKNFIESKFWLDIRKIREGNNTSLIKEEKVF